MFIRRKVNKSGTISVHVVDKSRGSYRVVKTFGSASSEYEASQLEYKARQYIREKTGELQNLFGDPEEDRLNEFMSTLSNSQIQVAGPELIFGALYDRIGYGSLGNDLFRHLVICRLFNPGSKLRTVDYLRRYLGVSYDVSRIYRFLDELCVFEKDSSGKPKKDANGQLVRSSDDIKSKVEKISFAHTKKVVGGSVEVVFYDMTTLYFEAEEDDLRIPGFSKDGKHSCPQIFLGLLVTSGGNPIGYEVYEGNIFEGHTLIPVIEALSKKYGLGNPTVIADSGLLSKNNIRDLQEKGYKYILGARPKNESDEMKRRILDSHLNDNDVIVLNRDDKSKLVVSMTESRAAKDEKNRERGLKRLQKKISGGRLTKSSINNRGYNKYLKMEGEVKISIDMEKFKADAAWDGIKAYVTNTDLKKEEVVANYGNLWYIERAFRMNKSDLRVRPIYHRMRNRIEGHICICFTAYTVMLEMERILKAAKSTLTLDRVREVTKTMYRLNYFSPRTNTPESVLLQMDEEQKMAYDLIHPVSELG